MEEAGSKSKVMIINYKKISLRKLDEKWNQVSRVYPLDRINPEYILGIVEQAYTRPYLDYIDSMYPYPINFRFPEFMLFKGQGSSGFDTNKVRSKFDIKMFVD
jgi:hypothetical protein